MQFGQLIGLVPCLVECVSVSFGFLNVTVLLQPFFIHPTTPCLSHSPTSDGNVSES